MCRPIELVGGDADSNIVMKGADSNPYIVPVAYGCVKSGCSCPKHVALGCEEATVEELEYFPSGYYNETGAEYYILKLKGKPRRQREELHTVYFVSKNTIVTNMKEHADIQLHRHLATRNILRYKILDRKANISFRLDLNKPAKHVANRLEEAVYRCRLHFVIYIYEKGEGVVNIDLGE